MKLSELDSARFGFAVAKAAPGSPAEWREALAACAQARVKLLIARIDAAQMALAQQMEADGAFLADVLLTYRLAPVAAVPAALENIRPATPADAEVLRTLARRAFRDYVGHYHADPRLPREACDEVYADWAHSACLDRAVADEVLLAQDAGFAALRFSAPGEADGMLFGVAPEARGRGVFTALLGAFLSWAAARGARSATYVTQLANPATHKTLARFGFAVERSQLTFHKWFG